MKRKSEYEQIPTFEFAEVGQRFAIRYGDITGAISGVKISQSSTCPPMRPDSVTTNHRTRYDQTNLATKEILGDTANLWTVVEYLQ